MSLGVTHAWVLWLLPLGLIPLALSLQRPVAYSSLELVPADVWSDLVGVGLRVAGSIVIALLLLGLSGLFRPAHEIERIGQGAQIVLLLDRSRSMDEPFAGQPHPLTFRRYDSKGKVARGLLSDFAASRRNDMFSMLVFSSEPIEVLPLTDKQTVIQAAIEAGNIGRGLAETDVGAGLLRAIEVFADRAYTGSRIIMLISDGGARLDLETRARLENLMKRHRIALYWIYVRSRYSPGISDAVARSEETAPARALHEFFSAMGIPYRAYDAENPEALARAIDDVSRLQSLPIKYTELVPKRELASLCYGVALLLMGVLMIAKLLEIRAWR